MLARRAERSDVRWRPTLPAAWAPLAVAAFIALLDNNALWRVLWQVHAGMPAPLLIISVLVALTALIVVPLQALNIRAVFKPAAILLLLVSALASYAISRLGVLIDAVFMHSLFETDAREVRGYFAGSLWWHLGLFWLLPSAALLWIRVERRRARQTLVLGCVIALASMCLAGTAIAAGYKSIALVAREHRELRMYLVPIYPLFALARSLQSSDARDLGGPRRIAIDAVRAMPRSPRPLLFVLVVGETARAMEFSLNGYVRPTNPTLAQHHVLSLTASSCGTSTAVSVPCMFSSHGREAFDLEEAPHEENLLDVLQRLGVAVHWYDNNSGCKGVCARVPHSSPDREPGAAPCNGHECYDEVLVAALMSQLTGMPPRDRFAVLHTHGSHGPDYANRTPSAFKRFLPECRDSAVATCPSEEIVNAYDNTIVYTDHVLSRLIDQLSPLSDRFDIAMLYVSDHGESLGEHGVYLHGFPYRLAPKEQTSVPMILWANDGFMIREGVTRQCLNRAREDAISHDAVWHTVLGAYDVRTRTYEAGKDLLASCRQTWKQGEHS